MISPGVSGRIKNLEYDYPVRIFIVFLLGLILPYGIMIFAQRIFFSDVPENSMLVHTTTHIHRLPL